MHRVTISGGGLTARFFTWGATLQDLHIEDHPHSLVLGFADFADYPRHSPWFGQTVGRYANRIAGGRFSIDGTEYRLGCNDNDHHLHGGADGMAFAVWDISVLGEDHVVFTLTDPDGHAGYPGTCRAAAHFSLKPGGCLSVVYRVDTDRPTVANLAHHSYFNLDGAGDIFDHELMLAADHYLPVDGGLIPTGEVAAGRGTPFDFRRLRPIRDARHGNFCDYDHNFCLGRERGPVDSAAFVRSLRSGIAMEVRTGEPGIQFYAGGMLATDVPGFGGHRYGRHEGFCLETQTWPDSPNRSDFPQAVLRPGETLIQSTDYVFMHE